MQTVRSCLIALSIALSFLVHAYPGWCGEGEPSAVDPVVRTLESQKALAAARKYLRENNPERAVSILEENLAGADGSTTFIALLRDAYIAELRRLRLENNNPARLALIRERLRRLDPTADTDTVTAPTGGALPATPSEPSASPPPPPPPISLAEPASHHADPLFSIESPTLVPSGETALIPPKLQAPKDERDYLSEGRKAFLDRRYSEAAGLLGRAHQAVPLQGKELAALIYCKLARISDRLKEGIQLEEAIREATEAHHLAKDFPALREQATKLLSEATKQQSLRGSKTSSENSCIESDSFKVYHTGESELAVRVRDEAERVRAKVFSTWAGPNAAAWVPKCEIHLHPNGATYEQVTGKSNRLMGHAGVAVREGKVVTRRIDLRIDDPTLLSGSVPEHVADVVLGDLFIEQPLPRWAEVAISTLAKSESEVSRYLRTLARCQVDGSFIPIRDLFALPDFPASERITAFYVESVSLVDFLVRRRGPKTFVIFLKQAQRYGYEKALREQYGYGSLQELQQDWLSAAAKGI